MRGRLVLNRKAFPDEYRLAVPICHLSEFALFEDRMYSIFLPLVVG